MRSDRFTVYLSKAIEAALERADTGDDEGALWDMNELCRRGVKRNWDTLTDREFLKEFLWVIGAIQKPIERHKRYYPLQVKLFRRCSPKAILEDRVRILAEWHSERRDLNRRMVDAMLVVSCRVATEGWVKFKLATLPLPKNPESEDPRNWRATYAALDALPMVGDANVWFLLRNLLGAPFLKPDIHIRIIAERFLGVERDPLAALSAAASAS